MLRVSGWASKKKLILCREQVDERELDKQEIKEDHSYFASGSALVILGNVAVLAMRHFDGTAAEVFVAHNPADSCCNADCSDRSYERCPRVGDIVI